MKSLFELVFSTRKHNNEMDLDSPYIKEFNELEEKITGRLNDNFKEYLEEYKQLLIKHLQYVYDDECEFYLYYGALLGQEIESHRVKNNDD